MEIFNAHYKKLIFIIIVSCSSKQINSHANVLAPERPAVFLRSLEDVAGEEEGQVCLQCEISKDSVSPVWRKDNVVLTSDVKHELLQLGKSMALIIHSLSKDDAGQYICDLGTSQSKAKVTVHGKKK